MNSKSILTTALTMLFTAGCAGEEALNNYKPVVQEALQYCKATDTKNADFGDSPVNQLRDLITWQLGNASYDKELFLQQAKIKIDNDESTYASIELGLKNVERDDEVRLLSKARFLKENVRTGINRLKFTSKLDKFRFGIGKIAPGSDEELAMLTEMANEIEILRTSKNGGIKNLITREIDFSDEESVSVSIEESQKLFSLKGILGFGLQGFNDLFGDHQGIRRGETVVVGALQHKYKSGTLMNSAIQVAYFNEPTFLRLPEPKEGEVDKRKALIIHLTLENDPLKDVLEVYRYIREQELGYPVKVIDMDEEEKASAKSYIMEFFKKRGFHFKLVGLPAGIGYAEIFALIEAQEELGYEVQFMSLDYMGKMGTQGCTEGPHGKNIQDLYQRIQNYMMRKQIAFMTAHQLSSEAKALERNGEEILVKAICELGYYAGCRAVDNEVDMEIYQHLVVIGDKTYITWQRGKHRKIGTTPSAMKFCIYEMTQVGSIPWDVGRERRTMSRLPGYGNSDMSMDMF